MSLTFTSLKYEIIELSVSDIDAVDELAKKFSKTIGFLPLVAFKEFLSSKQILGAVDEHRNLLGFLTFSAYSDYIRIVQLCVNEAFQGKGIANNLIELLKSKVTSQKVIRLSCRRDYEANQFWSKAGFIPFTERIGRSAMGYKLTTWCLPMETTDELGLWESRITNNTINVVIDAQIFFDFYEPTSEKSLISKGLLGDFMTDLLDLWITDELFVEIERQSNETTRVESNKKAHGFERIGYSLKWSQETEPMNC